MKIVNLMEEKVYKVMLNLGASVGDSLFYPGSSSDADVSAWLSLVDVDSFNSKVKLKWKGSWLIMNESEWKDFLKILKDEVNWGKSIYHYGDEGTGKLADVYEFIEIIK